MKRLSDAKVAEEDGVQLKALPKVFFCSRTHSQLAQFVREIKKTAFKNVRVVSLGSRKNLCVNPAVKSLRSESRINDACLDLKEKSKKKEPPAPQDQDGAATPASGSVAVAAGPVKKRKKPTNVAAKGCPFLGFEATQSLADQSLAKVYSF